MLALKVAGWGPASPSWALKAETGGWFGVITIDSRSGSSDPVGKGEPGISVRAPLPATLKPGLLAEPFLLKKSRPPSGVSARALPFRPPVAKGCPGTGVSEPLLLI